MILDDIIISDNNIKIDIINQKYYINHHFEVGISPLIFFLLFYKIL